MHFEQKKKCGHKKQRFLLLQLAIKLKRAEIQYSLFVLFLVVIKAFDKQNKNKFIL